MCNYYFNYGRRGSLEQSAWAGYNQNEEKRRGEREETEKKREERLRAGAKMKISERKKERDRWIEGSRENKHVWKRCTREERNQRVQAQGWTMAQWTVFVLQM